MEEEPMLDVLLEWAGDAHVDEVKLAADVNELVFDYDSVPLKDIRIGTLLKQFAAIIRNHSIVMPSDLTLMFKALITMEGLGRQYDPSFHVIDHLTPMLREAIVDRHWPTGLLRRGRSTVAQFVNLVTACRATWPGCYGTRGAARPHRPRCQAPRSFGKRLDGTINQRPWAS
jgi:ubiquinone biosynthesis protein